MLEKGLLIIEELRGISRKCWMTQFNLCGKICVQKQLLTLKQGKERIGRTIQSLQSERQL